MSHGSGGAVPNLTPLLDVVLQLLMFFMMCVNFVSENLNQGINLPLAQAARPMDKSDASSVLFLNVNKRGELEVSGQEPMNNKGDLSYFLKQQYTDAERKEKDLAAAEHRAPKPTPMLLSVVIRADERAEYEKVFDILSLCKEVGYKKLQLRAKQKNAG